MWVNVKFREKNKRKGFQGRSKNVSAKNSSSYTYQLHSSSIQDNFSSDQQHDTNKKVATQT